MVTFLGAGQFGLAPWTVEMACLLKGYEPWTQPFPVEVSWPTIKIITENEDPLFLSKLRSFAWNVGLDVIQRRGQIEILLRYETLDVSPDEDLSEYRLPPRDLAFKIRTEYPPLYPSEARQRMDKDLSRIERRLLKELGYPVGERMRSSPLVDQADKLKLDQGKLPSGGIYEIIDENASSPDEDGDLSNDQQLRNLFKSQRNRLNKRLRPYLEES